MLNICLMFLTIIFGLYSLWLFRRKSELLKIILIIATFSISRLFFRFEWEAVTGGEIAVFPTAAFYLLLLFNFLALSVFFISTVNLFTNQRLNSLGWTRDKIGKHIVLGMVLGGLLFFVLTFNKNLGFENLPGALFLGFFIASWQEENIFRGYLIAYFNQRFDAEEIIIYQALVFALAHIGFYSIAHIIQLIVSLIFAFILGLILGYLRLKTKSQIPGFIIHGIVDVAFLI